MVNKTKHKKEKNNLNNIKKTCFLSKTKTKKHVQTSLVYNQKTKTTHVKKTNKVQNFTLLKQKQTKNH